jgi:hypothetical protein
MLAISVTPRRVPRSSQSSVMTPARAATTEAISTVSPRPTRRKQSSLALGRVRQVGMRVGTTAFQHDRRLEVKYRELFLGRISKIGNPRVVKPLLLALLSSCAVVSGATNLTNLTDSVMNGWRADFQREMTSLIDDAGCASAVDLKNLADAVMNEWRADFTQQMGSLLHCSGCSSFVNLKNLTDSVMNGWRADFKEQMGSLVACIGSKAK